MTREQTVEERAAQRRKEAAAKAVRTRRMNALKRKMKDILAALPDDQRFIASEMADNYIFLSVRVTELREALDKQPTIITYDNGGGQKGLRENPYLATYNKLVTRHADLCMKLVKLIPGEAEDVRDELEKFIGL